MREPGRTRRSARELQYIPCPRVDVASKSNEARNANARDAPNARAPTLTGYSPVGIVPVADGNPNFTSEQAADDENARSSPSMNGEIDKSPGGRTREPLRRLIDIDIMSSEHGQERLGSLNAEADRSPLTLPGQRASLPATSDPWSRAVGVLVWSAWPSTTSRRTSDRGFARGSDGMCAGPAHLVTTGTTERTGRKKPPCLETKRAPREHRESTERAPREHRESTTS